MSCLCFAFSSLLFPIVDERVVVVVVVNLRMQGILSRPVSIPTLNSKAKIKCKT